MISLEASVLHPFSPVDEDLIVGFLQEGHVIVYPTDTLYGLGADACSEQAVASVYRLKQRQDVPVSVLTSNVSSLLELSKGLSEKAIRLIQTFLPGALTVICHTDYPFSPRLFSTRGTLGFRVPADTISTRIPALLGHPITTTSVNPTGLPPALSAPEVYSYFEHEIPLMIDAGPLEPSRGSTVIDVTRKPFRIIREGEISRHALEEFIN